MGGKKSFINKVLSDVGKVGSDITTSVGKGVKDIGGQIGRLDKIILSPTNEKEEAAKDEAKADERQQKRAIAEQEQRASDLLRQKASNESTGGSNIILGKKGKKSSKGSAISSGLGLSKGKTGLQT
jgi:hypothetical protein